jgi:hypothetical protein
MHLLQTPFLEMQSHPEWNVFLLTMQSYDPNLHQRELKGRRYLMQFQREEDIRLPTLPKGDRTPVFDGLGAKLSA